MKFSFLHEYNHIRLVHYGILHSRITRTKYFKNILTATIWFKCFFLRFRIFNFLGENGLVNITLQIYIRENMV